MDTNLFQIELETLKNQGEVATGDPYVCRKCGAVFNMYSQLGADKKWKCEFCHEENVLDIDDEERPQTNDVKYMIEAAPQQFAKETKEGEAQEGQDLNNTSAVIFAIDTSGSMQAICPGGLSRLGNVKIVIDKQIEEMAKDTPNRKLGIVKFGNTVDIVGDGSQNVESVAARFNYDKDFLMKNGKKQASVKMTKTIAESKNDLVQKVKEMRTAGATALGPAVATAIAMAGECGAGSQVIICTDGMANQGVG